MGSVLLHLSIVCVCDHVWVCVHQCMCVDSVACSGGGAARHTRVVFYVLVCITLDGLLVGKEGHLQTLGTSVNSLLLTSILPAQQHHKERGLPV